MIELKTHLGETSVTLQGSEGEIFADCLIAIKSIHKAIKVNSKVPGAEERFREFVLDTMNDDEFWKYPESDETVSASDSKNAILQLLHDLGIGRS